MSNAYVRLTNILKDFKRGKISPDRAETQIMSLFNVVANSCFDSGFDISTERFNAEFRDDYSMFDTEDLHKYELLKLQTVLKHLSPPTDTHT
jgi:hypothetical protein